MGFFDGKDEPGAIDTVGEYSTFIVILLLMGSLAGGVYVYNNANLDDKIYALTHDQPDFSGEKIVFKQEYDGVNARSSINKIYTDTDTEYGWCMRIEENNVTRLDTFTLLNSTSPGSIRFSCNPEIHNGIMHTHPDGEGYRGITALSEKDEKTLKNSSWIEASCVIGGEISTEEVIEGIGCWNQDSKEIQELEVGFS